MGTPVAVVDTGPDTAAEVLSAARARRRAADAAEADLLQLAVEWAAMHPVESIHEPATYSLRGFGQTDLALAGPGAPTVAEYAVPELAAALGLSTEAGKRYLGEALELRHRLPRLWTRVMAGDLAGWRARLVARETTRLSPDAAGYVDRHLAPVAHRVKPAQLDRLVAEAIGRHMPDEVERLAAESWDKRHVTVFDQQVSFTGTMHLEADLDLADALDLDAAVRVGAERRALLGSTESLDVRRARAVGDLARAQLVLDLTPDTKGQDPTTPRVTPRQVVLHVHLAESAVTGRHGGDPVARLERGNALVTTEQVRAWCGHPDTRVVVKPVIDLTACTWTDLESQPVPDKVAEHVAVRDTTCVFPWCTRPARSCDSDHVHPRSRGGTTCSCNLAALCRRHHRLKTHSPWTSLTLDPGRYLWTSPHGYQFLRDHPGTPDVSPDRAAPASDRPARALTTPPRHPTPPGRAAGMPGPGSAYRDAVPEIHLLADHPALVEEVGVLRWREWGYDDPSPAAWIETTRREAGRDELPVTLVAVDEDRHALGAVALGAVDEALTDDERRDRTPWLLGMVVREAHRRTGVGRALVGALEDLARSRGHLRVWVVTGARAVGFYRACGWIDVEDLVTTREHLPSTVLFRDLRG